MPGADSPVSHEEQMEEHLFQNYKTQTNGPPASPANGNAQTATTLVCRYYKKT